MRKYKNIPCEVDGIRFDSKKEATRYGELKLLEKAGEIEGLELQPAYPIVIHGKKICTYKADFLYWVSPAPAPGAKFGSVVRATTEDVKSPITRKNPTYRLKKKLVEAIYGIEIREV